MVGIRKEVKTNFAVIPNELLSSNELSWKAKGILCYLLSKPDDWTGQFYDIRRAGKYRGLKAIECDKLIRSAMKELVCAGYAKRVFKRDDSRIKGSGYVVSNAPIYTDITQTVTLPNGEPPETVM